MVEQLKYDVVSGIWHHKKRMLILVAVIIGIYIFMAVTCHGFLTSQEYIKILFRGMPYTTDERKFILPNGLWLAVNIVLSLYVGMLVSDDLDTYGKLRLMRLGSKIRWWLSKTMIIMISVVLYYFLIIGTAVLCGYIPGLFKAEYAVANIIGEISLHMLATYMFKMTMVSLMVSMVQAVITLIDLKAGIVTVVVFLAVVMYDRTHTFLGNYLMVARMYDGIGNTWTNMMIIIVTIVAAILSGIYLVKKKSTYIWR